MLPIIQTIYDGMIGMPQICEIGIAPRSSMSGIIEIKKIFTKFKNIYLIITWLTEQMERFYLIIIHAWLIKWINTKRKCTERTGHLEEIDQRTY